jgi:hypothetical protein
LGGLSWAAGCFAREPSVGQADFGWAALEWEREAAAGPDSVSSRVSAQYWIGIRKILFFFKSFL